MKRGKPGKAALLSYLGRGLRNHTVIGDKGRGGTGNAIIDARYGQYDKTLIFDGLQVDNPNAALFDFWNEAKNGRSGGKASIRIDNADLKFEKFQKRWNMQVDLKICGQEYDPYFSGKKIKCR